MLWVSVQVRKLLPSSMNTQRLAESMLAVHVYNTDHLKKGSRVTVVAGEFEGMEGTILKNCSDGNFSVQIEKLNISLVVSLEPDLLQVTD